MLRHPEEEFLEGLTRSLDTGTAGLFLHLLRCEVCAARAEAVLAPLQQRVGVLVLRRGVAPIDYSRLWEQIEERNREAVERLREERSGALPVLRELLRHKPAERLELVRTQMRFRSWRLADLLLDQGRAHPEQREELSHLVLALCDAGLPPHAERGAGDLRAAALCEIGETCRARGRLEAAEAAFEEAARELSTMRDPLERAKYCHLLAALRRDQGRLDEALGLLGRAADLLEESGHRSARAAVLVELGSLALDLGEAPRALEALGAATAPGRHLSAGLALAAAQGVALALAAEGRCDEALASLGAARELYGWTAASGEGLRLLSVEGRLALSVGRLEEAREALTAAFHGFIQLGEPFEACCAAAHLARTLRLATRSPRQEPRQELRQLAHQLRPLLDSPKIPEEARGLLSSFVEAASGSGPLGAVRLREMAGALERLRERVR